MSAPDSSASASAAAASTAAPATAAEAAAVDAPVGESQLLHALEDGQHHHGGSAQDGDREVQSNLHVAVSWKKEKYSIEIPHDGTVGFLKMQIALLSNVRPHHQKLVLAGAKLPAGAKLSDDMLLRSLNMKLPAKVMMVGNPEDQLVMDDDERAAANEPFDDLDYEYRPAELDELQRDPEVRARVDKYHLRTKDTFCLISPIRSPGKKLLVLDLDYTLFDMKGPSDTEADWLILQRPGTHEFLAALYQHYELVIWSQTSWRWLEFKLTQLGILTHTQYKVCFVMDKTSMFTVKSGSQKHHVKCLELIWRKFPQWNASNTVHVDDLGRNFALNPKCGLKISAYKNSRVTHTTDRELGPLSKYLAAIASVADFNQLDHARWKQHPSAQGEAAASSSSNSSVAGSKRIP